MNIYRLTVVTRGDTLFQTWCDEGPAREQYAEICNYLAGLADENPKVITICGMNDSADQGKHEAMIVAEDIIGVSLVKW